MDIVTIIVVSLSLIVAITIHEFSHAFVADHFGDPTPRAHGRLSLNPLRHLDPLGTLMLVIFHFGWGKPVPIDPYNLSRREEMAVALAGPGSNIILSLLLASIIRFIPTPPLLIDIIRLLVQMNILLAVFNLLPIPPLDGSKFFLNLLPEEKAIEWEKTFDQYGFFLLAALLFLPVAGSNIISLIISPVINFLLHLLLGT